MTKVIGITGLAGSGKDTLALSLSAALGDASILTFADPIRKTAAALGLCIYDRDKKEEEVSLRFEHFEVSLIEAMTGQLEDYVGEETLCDLYASFVTILRSRDYLTTGRQDVLTISPRRFCQLLGSDAAHSVRRSLWIDVFRARVKGCRSSYVLVPDTRFKNETLVCDALLGLHRPGVAAVAAHVSEQEIMGLVAGADSQYMNDGSLNDLNRYAKAVAESIKDGAL